MLQFCQSNRVSQIVKRNKVFLQNRVGFALLQLTAVRNTSLFLPEFQYWYIAEELPSGNGGDYKQEDEYRYEYGTALPNFDKVFVVKHLSAIGRVTLFNLPKSG